MRRRRLYSWLAIAVTAVVLLVGYRWFRITVGYPIPPAVIARIHNGRPHRHEVIDAIGWPPSRTVPPPPMMIGVRQYRADGGQDRPVDVLEWPPPQAAPAFPVGVDVWEGSNGTLLVGYDGQGRVSWLKFDNNHDAWIQRLLAALSLPLG